MRRRALVLGVSGAIGSPRVLRAQQKAVPVIGFLNSGSSGPEFPRSGGLMGYGANVARVFHDLANYTGRILKGVKPEDLPVEQTTKIEVVINLTTAKALGLTVPRSILARADEVIE